jgi:FMN reductase
MRILVISAGLGSPSATQLLGDRLAKSARRVLEESVDRVEIEHIELREIASDLANLMVTRVPSPRLVEVMDAVTHATGVVAVTPVMNSSYSGLFKMFFDALDQGAMKGRPVLMAATGGTARHSLMIENAMLPMFFYLKAVPSPMGVFAATEDWGSADSGLSKRIEDAAAAFAELLLEHPASEHIDEFSSMVDFETLLRGAG